MARNKKAKTKRDDQWAEAKRLCRLNVETVRMAQELGLNPRKLVKNRPSNSEPWKAPVHIWIRDLYEKSQAKPARKRAAKAEHQVQSTELDSAPDIAVEFANRGETSGPRKRGTVSPDDCQDILPPHALQVGDDDFLADELRWFEDSVNPNPRAPGKKKIARQNRALMRRRDEFRIAAEYVGEALAEIRSVRKIVLFGSVVAPLYKEVPRFREYRRAGVELWHECNDVDLAVWPDDTAGLKRLQKAVSRTVNRLFTDMQISVPHFQIDIHILEPVADRYLGHLCNFGKCPKHKPPCYVPGCGATPFLQQHENFTFQPHALAPDRTVVLFDREHDRLVDCHDNDIPF